VLEAEQYSPVVTISYTGKSRRRAFPIRPDTPPTSTSTSTSTGSSSWPSTLGSPIHIMPKSSFGSGSNPGSGSPGYRRAYYDDPENNATTPTPRRLARRLALHKRSRWMLGFAIAATTLVLLTYHKQESMRWVGGNGRGGEHKGGPHGGKEEGRPGGMDDIWHAPQHDDDHREPHDHHGHRPPHPPTPPMATNPWTINEHGDQFRRQPLPPMHPDIASLPSPSSLFPEVNDIASFLQPPTYEPFPDTRIRDIISDPPLDPSAPDRSRFSKLSAEAYANTWTKSEQWKPDTGEMRKLQWDGFSTGRRDTWETKEEGEVRKERKDAVKRGFVYAWQKYKDHAWGELHSTGSSCVPRAGKC